jgi:hypothetical protein
VKSKRKNLETAMGGVEGEMASAVSTPGWPAGMTAWGRHTTRRCVVAGSVIALLLAISGSAQTSVSDWQTVSQSPAITLADVHGDEILTRFEFQNVSAKTVTAFSIAWLTADGPDPITHYIDYFRSTTEGLLPGASYALKLDPRDAGRVKDRIFHVNSVHFADGSSEGSVADIKFVDARRLGIMYETKRVSEILNDPGRAYTDASAETITALIGPLPKTKQAAFDSLKGTALAQTIMRGESLPDSHSVAGFVNGVSDARGDALRLLQQWGPGGDIGSTKRISELQSRYRRATERHEQLRRDAKGDTYK